MIASLMTNSELADAISNAHDRAGDACDVQRSHKKHMDALLAVQLERASVNFKKSACRWIQDEDGVWFSSCGEAHVFTDGTPRENKFLVCPYCGRSLEQVDEIMGSGERMENPRLDRQEEVR